MTSTPLPLKLMISSSVYGAESLLRQTYATLLSFGYEVFCSPVGALPVNPNKSNISNCLKSVEECNIFISFIRPIYGSGRDLMRDKSITHLELEKAIDLRKPRWVLAHSSVVKMRRLLQKVFYNKDGSRNETKFMPLRGEFDDVRVIEMYELAADSKSNKPWSQRVNHWVHEYHYDFEALDFIKAQFSDSKRVTSYLNREM